MYDCIGCRTTQKIDKWSVGYYETVSRNKILINTLSEYKMKEKI